MTALAIKRITTLLVIGGVTVLLFLCAFLSTNALLPIRGGENTNADNITIGSDEGDVLAFRRRRRQLYSNHRTRPHNNITTSEQHPKQQQQTKIINGDAIPSSTYPFLASLGFCAGTLISPDIVLTAAHCINSTTSGYRLKIWDGTTMKERIVPEGKGYVVINPSNNPDSLRNDLALMKLSEPHLPVNVVNAGTKNGQYWELVDQYDWKKSPPILRLQRYQKPSRCTALTQSQAKDITNMIVIGNGVTELGYPSAAVREADVNYILNELCKKQYGGSISIDMLCSADTVAMQDSCQGDSGGPLFTRLSVNNGKKLFTQVGVVSWGNGCAQKNFPGVYSRVGVQVNWIDEAVCGSSGLSRLSCTLGGDGVRRITDYAFNSLVVAGDISRRTKMNVVTTGTRADVVYGIDWRAEACELLGGSVDEDPLIEMLTTPRPQTNPASTSRPTRRPTTTTKPTRQQTTRPTATTTEGRFRSCPSKNKVDLNKFQKKNSLRWKDCKWAKKKCSKRCGVYFDCCPQTCSSCIKSNNA